MTTPEIIHIGYRLEDTLYIYDAITHCPLSYDNGHWTVETGLNDTVDNPDEYAAHITCQNTDDWEDNVGKQLLETYNLRLGPLHDWNEYDLMEE